jgi:hypothetical protein
MSKLRDVFKLREAVAPEKLHDPQDFVAKLREVAAETTSQSAGLCQFLDTVDGNPEFNLGAHGEALKDALNKLTTVGKELADLVAPVEQALTKKEQAEDEAKAGKSASKGPGTTFKKV